MKKNSKTYKNFNFPNKSIDVILQPVGGGIVVQYENQKPSQSIVLAKKAFNTFIEEIEKEGWKAA